ncbi:acyl-CoA dehydratase activase [Anaerosporobacter sp.]|uniref:acyl-CoA dehydratase activase n=1 Tax=Anaerosporobacter sp. TaxID=1872529 RepID=UPI00286F1A88|nr:acyl-CoA dehydratase activase [Anaerosporobacter sp.]
MIVESYKVREVVPSEEHSNLLDHVCTVGIDIGSRQSKAVLIHNGTIYVAITASGVSSQETAEKLVSKLVKKAEINQEEITKIITTGYGRVAIDFSNIETRNLTEITCHALGAHYLNPSTRTIIDIGGQDCKAIKVNPENGHVIEFVMNDKCAAGTGRFLEKTAEMLGYSLEELGARALESNKKIEISSQCVVFAESEIISLKARGEKGGDIAAGIHFATARRVKNLVNRLGIEPELVFSGGVSNNLGMRKALEEVLKHPIKSTNLDTVYCGALGAAIYATKSTSSESKLEDNKGAV